MHRGSSPPVRSSICWLAPDRLRALGRQSPDRRCRRAPGGPRPQSFRRFDPRSSPSRWQDRRGVAHNRGDARLELSTEFLPAAAGIDGREKVFRLALHGSQGSRELVLRCTYEARERVGHHLAPTRSARPELLKAGRPWSPRAAQCHRREPRYALHNPPAAALVLHEPHPGRLASRSIRVSPIPRRRRLRGSSECRSRRSGSHRRARTRARAAPTRRGSAAWTPPLP